MPIDDPNANPGDKGHADGGETPNDKPKFMTVEEVNKAIASKLGAFEKKITGSITEAINGLAPKIDEALDAKIREHVPAPEGKGKDKGKTGDDLADHPVVKGMQKQLSDALAKVKSAEDTAAAERAKVRDRDLREKLSQHLSSTIKDPTRLRHAVGQLVDADKRVRWSETDENEVEYVDDDGPVDLKTGLSSWSKTEDAKIYISPTNAEGSGDRGGGKGPGAKNGSGYKRGDLGNAILGMANGMSLTIGPQPPSKT